MSSDPLSITLKTAVNTRAPLSDRVSWRRQVNEAVSSKTALHRGIQTTYDAAYSSVPARTDPSAGNRFLSLLRSQVGAAGSGESAHLENGTVPVAEEQLQCERKQPEASQPSSPSRPKEDLRESRSLRCFEPVLTRHMPSEWETEQQASSRNVLPFMSHGFYSTARKIEREDDDRRSGLVGNTQRTVDIMRKRANNPLLCPAANNYHNFRPVRPPCVTDESGRPANYCLDIVDCTHRVPTTEEQLGFDMDPIARLPNAENLSQALDVQRRVITHMGTSHPLFLGTAKVMETALPKYTGHAPTHPRNIAAIHGNDTDPLRLWSKSFMTLAEHGGGVDARTNCKNPLVRKRGGIRAPQSKELPPKSEKGIRSTVEGSMLQATLKDTLPAEHAINQREDRALNSVA
ncbi:hypothetical protein MOQ_008389 [Trypanosoma cruzi marinkellei]|uniref:Uncharacterized protein n=1 Tax=Trypanosoma cruzi marinkellei TaxID=85056 RepID=K2MZS0_TRYCR|nr:hypothetical protein MOQ_008389 [Trypanosoma cruzi marinkellei]